MTRIEDINCHDCAFKVAINKHPWNKGDHKGAMSENYCYGCAFFWDDNRGPITILEENSLNAGCECFIKKEAKTNVD